MLQDVELELLEDMQDLGIHVDSKLNIVTSKANRTFGLIHKVFECKDSDIIIKLYKSLVRPLLEYNNVIWGPQYVCNGQAKSGGHTMTNHENDF